MIGAIGTVAGNLINSVAGLFMAKSQAKKQKKELDKVGLYETNPYAEKELALAQNLYQGRGPGFVQAEGNIRQNAADANAAIDNNATDASQALAIKAGIMGQAGDQFADLAARESVEKMQRAGMLTGAYRTMVGEGDKKWNDKLRKLQQTLGIAAAKNQNIYNGIQGIGNTAAMFGNMYDSGDFRKKKD